jgi:osmotically-inducible protein OsmY
MKKFILAAVVAAAGLAGCVPVALVGGAAGAGTLLVMSDRRSGETLEADRAIEVKGTEAVVQALPGRGHGNVASYYRKVLVTGEVPNEQDRQTVDAIVRALPGVQGVLKDLAVMPESGALDRSNDALITSKVSARLIHQNGVPAGSIKVVTERGTTYLMGRLTAQEMALATEVARQTDGVQRVVRVIDLIADSAGGTTGVATRSSAGGVAANPPEPAAPASADSAPGVVVQPVK